VNERAIRVLVVDDSAFARKVVREVLEASPGIEVVGIARDGLEALEQISALEPDVITLDLVMPNLDGVGLLRELVALGTPTRAVLVSMSDNDSELVLEALELGAIDLVRKPTALATDRLYDLRDELTRKVRAAATAKVAERVRVIEPTGAPKVRSVQTELVVIGTSTGGPHALTELFRALPAELPPVVVALHIPAEYTGALAVRLNQLSALSVTEAADGVELTPGMAVIAPGGQHLRIRRASGERLVVELDEDLGGAPYIPSVDVLFASAAEACGARTLALVLTGMGDDGLLGARDIHRAGGRLVVEAESSCVVYGMPRCVQEAGLALSQVPLARMAAELVKRL
jgi:two-component system chemotaxis response regulator CheB